MEFKMKIKYITYIVAGLLVTSISACKKFVTIDPPVDKIVANKIFVSDEMATSAMRGIYITFATNSGGPISVTMLAGRSADDFTNYHSDQLRVQFSDNNLLSNNANILQAGLWASPYSIIYATNAMLENLAASPQISTATKQQLAAEAKFIRAFCYFYLTNLFGDVPIILGTDYRVNAVAHRSRQDEVYQQITKDLEEARSELPDNYLNAERVRATKWVATALLARVYLYLNDHVKAESYSTEIINKVDRYNLITDDINKVFLKNNQEAIFQLFKSINQAYTNDGLVFILTTAPGSATDVVLSEDLYKAFDPGDLRQSQWIGSFTSGINKWYYPFKYKVKAGTTAPTEYTTLLRLGEQYLIRAEARINQGKIDLGIDDLNRLRDRARAAATVAIPNPLPVIPHGLSKQDALLAVEKERRTELFAEWGHRWLDLKRTGRADAVIGRIKGGNWQSTDQLYPIPNSERLNNSNLTQNPGYN